MIDSSSVIFAPSWVAATVPVVAFSAILGSSDIGGTAVDTTPAITYAADIAPIIARECASCHSPGGWAPFDLLTYEDVRSRAEQIAEAVEQGVMPPWSPESEPGTFLGERRLTAEEVDLFRQWADAGAPVGDFTAVANHVADPEWDPGPPDLIVKLPAYTVPAEGGDVYRNLVVPIPVTETRWVEYVELRPGSRTVIHHARVMVDTTASSRQLANRSENPGFDGMDPRSGASSPSGYFIGWAPGRTRLPPIEGMAWRLDPGTDLVLQLHVRASGDQEEVRAQVEFHFADEPPILEPAILEIFSLMIDIPAGVSDYTVTNSFELPVAVDILSVSPHAHYLGKDLRSTAVLPNGQRVPLIHIPNWDFNRQDEYRFTKPISLPAGTTILQEFSYDNTAANPNNPSSPPRRVVAGSSSTDEMAELIFQVLPRNSADRRRLVAAVDWKRNSEETAYLAESKFVQGQILFEEGDLDAATRSFQEVLRYRADHIQGLIWLSRVFAIRGDVDSSLLVARQGVKMSNRQDPRALDALAEALAALGQIDDAVSAAQEALPLARRQGETSLADSLEARIQRYRGAGER